MLQILHSYIPNVSNATFGCSQWHKCYILISQCHYLDVLNDINVTFGYSQYQNVTLANFWGNLKTMFYLKVCIGDCLLCWWGVLRGCGLLRYITLHYITLHYITLHCIMRPFQQFRSQSCGLYRKVHTGLLTLDRQD